QRRRAGDRTLLVGVMTERSRGESRIQTVAGDQGGERKDASTESLPKHEKVGSDSVVFEGEHPSGTAERDRNLIQDQQGPMAVAGSADLSPVIRGRDERGAAHGL